MSLSSFGIGIGRRRGGRWREMCMKARQQGGEGGGREARIGSSVVDELGILHLVSCSFVSCRRAGGDSGGARCSRPSSEGSCRRGQLGCLLRAKLCLEPCYVLRCRLSSAPLLGGFGLQLCTPGQSRRELGVDLRQQGLKSARRWVRQLDGGRFAGRHHCWTGHGRRLDLNKVVARNL